MAIKKLEKGTLFAVPLTSDNEFTYGYIAYHDGFIYSNIYDYIGIDKAIPDNIENNSLKIRDLMHDYAQFLPRMKRFGRGFFWPLSKKKVKNPLSPKSQYVLHGDGFGPYKIYDIYEKKYVQEDAISDDISNIPRQMIEDPSYYPYYIESKLKNKELYFDKETRSYVLKDR